MKNKHTTESVIRKFIENAGNLSQSFGLGRAIGQIYAYLYFSREPRSLADMQEILGISKGSASMNVRQLEAWGAVKQIWIKGDRKDYYKADDWFGGIIKSAVMDGIGKRLGSAAAMMREIDKEVDAVEGDGEVLEFIKGRIKHIREFEKKAELIASGLKEII